MGNFRTLLQVLTAFVLCLPVAQAQQQQWDSEDSYLTREQGDIVRVTLPAMNKQTLVSAAQLNPGNGQPALQFANFTLSPNGKSCSSSPTAGANTTTTSTPAGSTTFPQKNSPTQEPNCPKVNSSMHSSHPIAATSPSCTTTTSM